MQLQSSLVTALTFVLCWSLTLAATPTSFCKCVCFKNSTIIPLDAPVKLPASDPPSKQLLRERTPDKASNGHGSGSKPFRPGNCNDCTKQFCLQYNLPICRGATEEDVMTTCFQRDSSKDQAVVILFIVATTILLGWALIRPFTQKWFERARERRFHIPMTSD